MKQLLCSYWLTNNVELAPDSVIYRYTVPRHDVHNHDWHFFCRTRRQTMRKIVLAQSHQTVNHTYIIAHTLQF
jgi:hypothetical protein